MQLLESVHEEMIMIRRTQEAMSVHAWSEEAFPGPPSLRPVGRLVPWLIVSRRYGLAAVPSPGPIGRVQEGWQWAGLPPASLSRSGRADDEDIQA